MYNTICYQREYWTAFDKIEMDVMTAIDLLNQLVDESDPDVIINSPSKQKTFV